ncbi:MAG TPA: DNA gyrase subunit B [Myxococcus sp.]|nr:DNA gyrase subunit B [Myxococcus sp.]
MTDIAKLGFSEVVRKRPGMYVGDTGEYGLYHLVWFLLDAVFSDARRGEGSDFTLEAGSDNAISLFTTCRVVPPEELARVMAGGVFFKQPQAYAWGWSTYLPIVLALASRFQLDVWTQGRQWRFQGARGQPSGDGSEVTPAEPLPAGVSRAMRVGFVPDADVFTGGFAYDEARLLARCRELAALAPGLRARFTGQRTGQDIVLHYPGGVAWWLAELTAGRRRLHPEPLAFDVPWEELRLRCALQWCKGAGEVLSFANTVRTRRHGVHVDGVLMALRAALAEVSGQRASVFTLDALGRGLTAIIALDGPEERMSFAGPTKELLAIEGLKDAVRAQLQPLLVEALRGHPLATRLARRRRYPRRK